MTGNMGTPEWVRPIDPKTSKPCETNTCLEAMDVGDAVWVRNSEDPVSSLQFTYPEWEQFITGVLAGQFRFGMVSQ